MSGLQICPKLNSEELIVALRTSEGLFRCLLFVGCHEQLWTVLREVSRDGANLLARVSGDNPELFVGADAGAEHWSAAEPTRARLEPETWRLGRLLTVVDCIARMTEQGKLLLDVSDRIVLR